MRRRFELVLMPGYLVKFVKAYCGAFLYSDFPNRNKRMWTSVFRRSYFHDAYLADVVSR